jgi:hypothetical protein
VAGCCECGDEHSGSGVTELVGGMKIIMRKMQENLNASLNVRTGNDSLDL